MPFDFHNLEVYKKAKELNKEISRFEREDARRDGRLVFALSNP